MSSARYGINGISTYRRVAFVGPKILLDVVDDVKRHGRVAFLHESGIDLKKGKAFDAHLQMPARFGAKHFAGATGDLPPGGVKGRSAFRGTHSAPRASVGFNQNRVTRPSLYNGQ